VTSLTNPVASQPPRLFLWQARIFSLLWLAYASYYLCRLNFSAAQPAILKEFPEWTDAKIGLIPSVYAAVYAVGQFVNGQLSVRLGARRMMTVAMVCAGAANIAFSQVSSYPLMLVLWGLNGWSQSAGWSLAVGTMASWTPKGRRGFVIGLLSTCYMLGNVFAWLLAGALSSRYGWRTVFAVPGLVLLPMAALFAALVRNRPEDVGLPSVVEPPSGATAASTVSFDSLTAAQVLRLTLSNRVLWVLAIAFFCSNAVRYAFMNWSIQYIARFHGEPLGNSTFKAVALPLFGAVAAVGAGWASDTFFAGRRAPLSAIMLFGLSLLCIGFSMVPRGHVTLAMVLLGVAGFLLYGPDMLLSGAATVDFSHPRAAAAATGLTMSAGALGAVFSGAGVGWVLDQAHGEWAIAFYVLAALSLIPAIMMASLWNAKPKAS
jgi:OPA family glycerol-3-phosphate transporter-like MFS transporter